MSIFNLLNDMEALKLYDVMYITGNTFEKGAMDNDALVHAKTLFDRKKEKHQFPMINVEVDDLEDGKLVKRDIPCNDIWVRIA